MVPKVYSVWIWKFGDLPLCIHMRAIRTMILASFMTHKQSMQSEMQTAIDILKKFSTNHTQIKHFFPALASVAFNRRTLACNKDPSNLQASFPVRKCGMKHCISFHRIFTVPEPEHQHGHPERNSWSQGSSSPQPKAQSPCSSREYEYQWYSTAW